MNNKKLFCGIILFLTFQGSLYGSLWSRAKSAVSGAVSGGVDWTKGTVDSAGHTLIGEAGKAGHYVGEVAADGLSVVDSAGNWVVTAAGKLANAVGCMAKTGVSVSGDIIKSLAGAAISFDEISVEGTLGGATFTVKARGRIMQQPFNLSSSIGKDGFSQDGFKKSFYDPLAKTAESENIKKMEKDKAAQQKKDADAKAMEEYMKNMFKNM